MLCQEIGDVCQETGDVMSRDWRYKRMMRDLMIPESGKCLRFGYKETTGVVSK